MPDRKEEAVVEKVEENVPKKKNVPSEEELRKIKIAQIKKEIEQEYESLKQKYAGNVAEITYIERLLKKKDECLAIESQMAELQKKYAELDKA